MFAQVMADFDDRVREVDLYFQALAALDNDELAVVKGTGPEVLPAGALPTDCGRMLKGAAYLVLYNLVEAFVRRGFQALFESIQNDKVCGVELTELLRVQWIEQKNRKVTTYDGSPKVYMKIAQTIVQEIVNEEVASLDTYLLPISGNLDSRAIRHVCECHGISHSAPAAAKGGTALDIVKSKRNALAHGDVSFAECGRTLTAADLSQAKSEVVLFLKSILQNLETFVTNKSYKIQSNTCK